MCAGEDGRRTEEVKLASDKYAFDCGQADEFTIKVGGGVWGVLCACLRSVCMCVPACMCGCECVYVHACVVRACVCLHVRVGGCLRDGTGYLCV